MSGGRVHEPIPGRRYIVVRGPYKGRLWLFRAVLGDLKNNPPLRGFLCNGWGAPTDAEAIVKLSDVEV